MLLIKTKNFLSFSWYFIVISRFKIPIVIFQVFTATEQSSEQWNPNNYDIQQLYDQISKQYLINYYNYYNYYTNLQEFISHNLNISYPNIVYNNSISTNIKNSIPTTEPKIEKKINEEQTTIKPLFQRKNKILLPRIPNIRPMKPIKSKLRPVFRKS